MKLSAAQIQTVQQRLRNVAEVDPNDMVANASSQLAVDLEYVKTPFEYNNLNSVEQQLVQYAISKRDQYVMLPGNRHAVNLKPVFKERRRITKRLTTV